MTGCIAQIEKEKLLLEPYIDYVYGNEDKFNIANLLLNEEKFAVKDLMSENEFCEIVLDDTSKTRISLKIQDGCDNRCSYCIIPYGRGKSRSANSDFIIKEINRYSELGYKEVILTGIHIGLWGKEHNKELLDLLMEIENKTKTLKIDITNLDEETKVKLKGAIKFFNGEQNNTPVQVINGKNTLDCGTIFLNKEILKEFGGDSYGL